MQEHPQFRIALFALFALSPITLLALRFITAPYGRHARQGWGPQLSSRWAWVYMESPSLVLFTAVFFLGPHHPWPLGAMWVAHYFQRTVIYPLTLRDAKKPMPFVVASLGFGFNLLNASTNAWFLSAVADYSGWWTDPRFILGGFMFVGGFAMNLSADQTLRTLRAPGETGYKIPRGGLYRFISCPNYLGEMVEWTGFALAAWSPAGAAFALYTVANLAPRAVAHHRWYREKFTDYPPERRALIPFVL